MRRRSAVIVCVMLCNGCTPKTKPETQPQPVAAAPEASKPKESKPETSKPEASKTVPTPNGKTPDSTSTAKPAPSTAKPPPSTAKPAPSPAKPSTATTAPAAKGQTPQDAGTSAGNKPQPATPSRASATPTLDLEALKTELKQTKAIGLMTKLSLKNQVDDLLDEFRRHHAGKPTPTLAELRRSYDLLMMKVLSLLQDRDRKLASEIVSSREQIWGLLADPKKFATLQV
jgi:hypothetical protein